MVSFSKIKNTTTPERLESRGQLWRCTQSVQSANFRDRKKRFFFIFLTDQQRSDYFLSGGGGWWWLSVWISRLGLLAMRLADLLRSIWAWSGENTNLWQMCGHVRWRVIQNTCQGESLRGNIYKAVGGISVGFSNTLLMPTPTTVSFVRIATDHCQKWSVWCSRSLCGQSCSFLEHPLLFYEQYQNSII